MAQVQIGFSPVISDENLTMLERIHSAGVNVNIGVEFLYCYRKATGLQQRAQRGGRQALAQG